MLSKKLASKKASKTSKKAARKTQNKKMEGNPNPNPELQVQEFPTVEPNDLKMYREMIEASGNRQRTLENVMYVHLSGDSRKQLRQETLSYILKRRVPLKECGIHAMEPFLRQYFRMDEKIDMPDIIYINRKTKEQHPMTADGTQINTEKMLAIPAQELKRYRKMGGNTVFDYYVLTSVAIDATGHNKMKRLADVHEPQATPEPLEAVLERKSTVDLKEEGHEATPPTTEELKIDQHMTDTLKVCDTFDKLVALDKECKEKGLSIVTLQKTVLTEFKFKENIEGVDYITYNGKGRAFMVKNMAKYFVVASLS